MVIGTLTLPAFGMLAVLLSSVKVYHSPAMHTVSAVFTAAIDLQMIGLLQRVWVFRWLSTLLAVATSLVVSPVAALCNIVLQAGIFSLTALHLLPPPPPPPRLQATRHPT